MQKFGDYYRSLTRQEQTELSNALNIHPLYINNCLLTKNMKYRRIPSSTLVKKIHKATRLSYLEILAEFYPDLEREVSLIMSTAAKKGGCDGADQGPAANGRTDQSATKGDQDHDLKPEVGGQGIGIATDQSDYRG